MRVLHVIEAMHQGGAETLVVEHVRRAAPGIESTVVALNRGGPSLEAARAAGAEAVLLAKGEARLAGLQRLVALMRERRIEVVNGHNPTGAMYATLAARMAGVPVVVRTEHSIHYPGRGFRFYGPIEALITQMSDRVICVCEASRSSHAARLGFAAQRFVTILNGIAEPLIAPRERAATRASLGIAPDARMVLNVGSLTKQKSQDTLLRAFAAMSARVPEAVLCIAGEGKLEPRLRALHAELGLGERARFLGPRSDVPDLMEACDLFVLASSREGLSITLLEAMRASRAALATAVGGNAEAVADHVTGRIVPVQDVARMAAVLEEMLRDPAQLTAFGEAGRIRWQERFTAERMVHQTEALYREALARRSHVHPGGAA